MELEGRLKGYYMNALKISQNLYLIELEQNVRGFRKFIGSWVYIGDYTFLVDVGPSATVEELVKSLRNLGIKRLDYVLLTHIHLDHAGGIGELIERFPDAKVVCHERAVEHLAKPQNLWEATKKTLGDIAMAYGEMKPVSEKKIIPSFEFQLEGIEAINTPGHAVHHVSYNYGRYLFAGEAGGVFHSLKNEIYQRPATPPKFYLEEAIESIDKLLNLGKKQMCFGHFGIHKDSKEVLQKHREQLFLWKEVIDDQIEKSSNMGNLIEECISRLLAVDKSLMPFGYINYINSL
ncbi:MAG: MBL fold metallo-hydrolase [Desulfobacterales bacterium]|nr:MBL fold metallo-hydrolase [Desulfobacterales bacterium]